NENAPAIADATVAIDENSANATAVTNVSDSFTGTDFDRDGTAITYSITAGNTGGAFAIDSVTGAITVANSGALDFETNPSFTLTVTASDGSLSDTAAITVNLNNLNDNAPNIVDATVAINENSANTTAVTNISDSFTGTDFDRDAQAITYSITAGNTGGAFAIDAVTGAITVANSVALDFETTPSFSLTVTASDGSLSDTAAITVNLNNLNDNAPAIADATVAIDENSANTTAVTNISDSFTGTDFDRDAQAITYSISAGNTGGAFAINASTGAITVANSAALDF
ncbi:MAG: cadherin repeat domain-containing protein, partial [Burkholderiales bacterium]